MPEEIKEAVKALRKGDSSTFTETITSLLHSKAMDALGVEKINVAQKMFNEAMNDDEDSDDDENEDELEELSTGLLKRASTKNRERADSNAKKADRSREKANSTSNPDRAKKHRKISDKRETKYSKHAQRATRIDRKLVSRGAKKGMSGVNYD